MKKVYKLISTLAIAGAVVLFSVSLNTNKSLLCFFLRTIKKILRKNLSNMPPNIRRTIRIKLNSRSGKKYSSKIGKLSKRRMSINKVTNSNSTDLLTGLMKNSRIF